MLTKYMTSNKHEIVVVQIDGHQKSDLYKANIIKVTSLI